jgi:hypothetical protein
MAPKDLETASIRNLYDNGFIQSFLQLWQKKKNYPTTFTQVVSRAKPEPRGIIRSRPYKTLLINNLLCRTDLFTASSVKLGSLRLFRSLRLRPVFPLRTSSPGIKDKKVYSDFLRIKVSTYRKC